MPEGHGHNPMSHVVDHPTLELPHWQSPYGFEIDLPNLFGHRITRFMLMEVVAAILVAAVVAAVIGWFSHGRSDEGLEPDVDPFRERHHHGGHASQRITE